MALYVNPRTGSLRDVIIWMVEELKKLRAQVYALSQGGGSGGSQDLQQTLDNGNTAIGKDMTLKQTSGSIGSAYLSPKFIDVLSETQASLSFGGTDDDLRITYSKGGSTIANNLMFSGRTALGVANFSFPNVIEGDHILATIGNIYEVLYSTSLTFSTYANDAAADADTALPSGALYKITGNRQLFQKP